MKKVIATFSLVNLNLFKRQSNTQKMHPMIVFQKCLLWLGTGQAGAASLDVNLALTWVAKGQALKPLLASFWGVS